MRMCVHVYMYMYVYVYAYVYAYVCDYVYAYVYAGLHIYVYVYVQGRALSVKSPLKGKYFNIKEAIEVPMVLYQPLIS